MYTRRTSDIRYNDDDDDVVVLPPAVKQPPLVIDIDSDEEDDYRRVFKSHRQYRMKTVPTSGRITQRSTVTHRPVAHSHTKQEYLSSSTTIGPTIWTDRKVRFINTVNGGASIIKQDEFAPIRISTSIFHDDDDEPSNESVPVENPSSTFTSLPSYPFQIPMTNSYEIGRSIHFDRKYICLKLNHSFCLFYRSAQDSTNNTNSSIHFAFTIQIFYSKCSYPDTIVISRTTAAMHSE